MPSAKDIARIAHIPIEVYENYGKTGLSKIKVEKINCDDITTISMLQKTEILWIQGRPH